MFSLGNITNPTCYNSPFLRSSNAAVWTRTSHRNRKCLDTDTQYPTRESKTARGSMNDCQPLHAAEVVQREEAKLGMLVWLRKQPHKPLLPSIFLMNARSLANKMDELQSKIAKNHLIRECCVLIVTESWLHPQIPNGTVQLAGRTIHYSWPEQSHL